MGPQKAKNDPKIKPTINIRIQGNVENKSYSAILVDPKKVLQPHTNPKNITLGPQKGQNNPKLKIKIEGSLENKTCSAF